MLLERCFAMSCILFDDNNSESDRRISYQISAVRGRLAVPYQVQWYQGQTLKMQCILLDIVKMETDGEVIRILMDLVLLCELGKESFVCTPSHPLR